MGKENLKRCELSCDKTGLLFFSENRILRGIYPKSESFVLNLMNSDFFKIATEKKLFVETKVVEDEIDGFELVVEHSNLSPLCLAYEWTPAKIKKMALQVLQLMELCEAHGYCLVDPHVNNVGQSFSGFYYLDLGSFIKGCDSKVKEKSKAIFIRNFLFPLMLIERGQVELARSIFLRRAELPDSEIYKTQYFFRPLFLSIVIANMCKIWNKARIADAMNWHAKGIPLLLSKVIVKVFPKHNFAKELKGLNNIVRNKKTKTITEWANYQKKAKVQDLARFDQYIEIARDLEPFESAVDLACNEGGLAKKIIEQKISKRVFAIDTEASALESLDSENITGVLTLLSDVMRPDGRLYDTHIRERVQSDCVFALALTHHLYLTQGFSWNAIIESITKYTKRYLFIEFMPMGLYDGIRRQSENLPDDYSEEEFNKNIILDYKVIKRIAVSENRVLYVAELKKMEH